MVPWNFGYIELIDWSSGRRGPQGAAETTAGTTLHVVSVRGLPSADLQNCVRPIRSIIHCPAGATWRAYQATLDRNNYMSVSQSLKQSSNLFVVNEKNVKLKTQFSIIQQAGRTVQISIPQTTKYGDWCKRRCTKKKKIRYAEELRERKSLQSKGSQR